MNDNSTLRIQILSLVTVLLLGHQFLATPVIISAAEQEMPRRHSLIHRSAVESAALPATTQGTMLQPPGHEPTRITSPTGAPQTSISLPTRPLTHHRTLAKRPAIASTTAPPTSSQALRATVTPGVAAGQVPQTAADTAKGTIPTTTKPITKSTAAPLAGLTSIGTVVVTPTAPSPFVNAAAGRPVASAGSGSASSSGGSRSALNLLQNSAIASLLQPPTPVVTPPPSTPLSTPPSTPPPSPSTGIVTLTWTANAEPDLAGYKIYVGTASGTYSYPGSAFVTGTVTTYTVSNLPKDQTYFFAMTAYDSAGNESPLSAEVSKTLY